MRTLVAVVRKSALLLFCLALTALGSYLHAQDGPKEPKLRDRLERERKLSDEPVVDKNVKVVEGDRINAKQDRIDPKEDRPRDEDAKNTIDERSKSPDELRSEKARQLAENAEAGKKWEGKTEREIAEREGTDPYREVTLQAADGTRSRGDLIYRDKRGKYILVECKSSETADFTRNQREVFGSIRSGDEVTIRGNGMGEANNGEKIRISEIYVSRPDTDGKVRMEPYQDQKKSLQNPDAQAGKSP